MQTVGVDLAAQARKTAVAVVEWHAGRAVVERVAVGQDDAQILELIASSAKAGIDCPLGWPGPFIDFLVAQRDGRPLPPTDLAGRRALAYRVTDLAVKADTGVLPLSVAADLIGHTAMRAVGILSQLAATGVPIDRAGAGLVVEAYPAAALRRWQLYRPRYKGPASRPVREELVHDLFAALPALQIGAPETRVVRPVRRCLRRRGVRTDRPGCRTGQGTDARRGSGESYRDRRLDRRPDLRAAGADRLSPRVSGRGRAGAPRRPPDGGGRGR